MTYNSKSFTPSQDLKNCIDFHGHLCPGLIYGYVVSLESIKLLDIERSVDEETVTICENDSCSVDAFQIMLGTTSGKGNLIINNYGKNVYTVFSRKTGKAYRFSRKVDYKYSGERQEEFLNLEKKISEGSANDDEKKQQKFLKSIDLLNKPFDDIFITTETTIPEPPYAPLAPSKMCQLCNELTMETKLVEKRGKCLCIPCSTK